MRQGAGLICHWIKPFQAVLEFMAIFSLTFLVTILVPGLMWVAFAYPVAYVMDLLFGKLLRGGGPPCHEVAQQNPNITIEQCRQERESNGIYYLFTLLLVSLAIAFISLLLKRFILKSKALLFFSYHFLYCIFCTGLFPVVRKRIPSFCIHRVQTRYLCSFVLYLDFISFQLFSRNTDDCRILLFVRYLLKSF